jgi:hypothetical protein
MKRIVKFLVFGVLIIMSLGLFAGCGQTFTDAEHLQRITERVQNRFFAEGSEYADLYTDFSVELLYNAKDEPAYFMVEFEPDGFLYGVIDKGDYYFDYGGTSMTPAGILPVWHGGTFFRGSQWGETGEGWWKPKDFSSETQWLNELARIPTGYDEQTEWNFRSHFYVANTADIKKYMAFSYYAKSNTDFVIFTLVKRDDVYICVVSGQEYESTWFNNVSKDKLTNSQRKALTKL